ncbi:MAG: tyrosine-type recombinase/integrase [Candidatus Thiodiazotropha endolucinida]
MHLLEGLRLRVQDLDFTYGRIHIHQAKDKKDRYVPLPKALVAELQHQIREVERLHGEYSARCGCSHSPGSTRFLGI